MAYVLSRHAACRHALAMTLEAGYVHSAAVKGKARAVGSAVRVSSTISTGTYVSPAGPACSSSHHPQKEDSLSAWQTSEDRVPHSARPKEGIGVSRREQSDIGAGSSPSTVPTLSSHLDSPLSLPPHSPADPLFAYKKLVCLDISSMPTSKLESTISTAYNLLRSLQHQLDNLRRCDAGIRRIALRTYLIFFRLVERLQAEGQVDSVTRLLQPWIFDAAIPLLAAYHQIEAQTRRLEDASRPPLDASHPPLDAGQPDHTPPRQTITLIHPLRLEPHATALEASIIFKRSLSTTVEAPTLSEVISVDAPSPNTASEVPRCKPPVILTISSVLQVMADFTVPMSPKILESLIKMQEAPLIPTGPRASRKRAMLGLNHQDLGRTAVGVWASRRDTLDLTTGMEPSMQDSEAYSDHVMRTLDEADILSLQYHTREVEKRLEGMVPCWREKRDVLMAKARNRLRPLCEEWEEKERDTGGHIAKMVRAETKTDRRAVLFLLRNSLLPTALRWSPKQASEKQEERLTDSFCLLRLLCGLTIGPEPDETIADPILITAVLRMRNAFYHNNRRDDMTKLISFLSPAQKIDMVGSIPSSSVSVRGIVPRLPGNVYASLITTAKNDTEFRNTLVLLSCACPPITAVGLTNSTRRLLRYQAQKSAQRLTLSTHPAFRRMPQDAQARATAGGHEGLLDWLFDHWKVGGIGKRADATRGGKVDVQPDSSLVRPLRSKRVRPFGHLPLEDRGSL